MKGIPTNRSLFLISIIVIIISIMNIIIPLTHIGITGASSSGEGTVNITVYPVTDLSLNVNSINFTSATPGETRNSYNSSHVIDCSTDNHCGINMTNDGSVFINVTILETESLFDSTNYNTTQHFTYNTTIKDPLYTTGYGGDGSCSTGYPKGLPGPDNNGQTGQWRAVPTTNPEVAICYLNYTDDSPTGNDEDRPDVAVIELNITVPSDESSGLKMGTITFTASAAEEWL